MSIIIFIRWKKSSLMYSRDWLAGGSFAIGPSGFCTQYDPSVTPIPGWLVLYWLMRIAPQQQGYTQTGWKPGCYLSSDMVNIIRHRYQGENCDCLRFEMRGWPQVRGVVPRQGGLRGAEGESTHCLSRLRKNRCVSDSFLSGHHGKGRPFFTRKNGGWGVATEGLERISGVHQ